MTGWDKLEREISVFTLAHQIKLGWDNCEIKIIVPPQEVVNLSRNIIGINYPVDPS